MALWDKAGIPGTGHIDYNVTGAGRWPKATGRCGQAVGISGRAGALGLARPAQSPPADQAATGPLPSIRSSVRPTTPRTGATPLTSTALPPVWPRCRPPADAPEAARGYVDQHQVHGPTPQPVFCLRRLPARQCNLGAAGHTHARTLDRHLAAVEAQFARGSAPAITAPVVASPVPRTTQFRRVLFHHLSQGRDAGRQTEPLEACSHVLPCRIKAGRDNFSPSAIFLHGVAFPSWIRHPEPTGSRQATPTYLFQHAMGHFRHRSQPCCP